MCPSTEVNNCHDTFFYLLISSWKSSRILYILIKWDKCINVIQVQVSKGQYTKVKDVETEIDA